MIRYCTIVTFNDLPFAQVLADSLRRHHPDAELDVLILDPLRRVTAPGPGVSLLRPETIGLDEIGERITSLGYLGAATVLRPRLIDTLLENGTSAVVSFVPWLELHAPLDPLIDLLDRRSPTLTLRLPEGLPPEDGRRPHRLDVLDAGWLSPAVVAVRADDRDFTRWWTRDLERRAGAAPDTWRRHAYVSESALTAGLEGVPRHFAMTGFIGDPGWAVSAWNLHARPLKLEDGVLFAGASRLRLFDFTGFGPDRPNLLVPVERDSALGADVARVRPAEHPVLGELCRAYAERLIAVGWVAPNRRPTMRPELPDGVVYDALVAQLHELAAAEGEAVCDLEDDDAARALVAWLGGPAKHGGHARVTRYLHALHASRPDLRAAFPDLDGLDGDAFAAWAWDHGQAELGLAPVLLPPRPGAASPVVRVQGHLRDGLGLGHAARLYVQALTAAGVNVTTRTVAIDSDGSIGSHRRTSHVEFEELDSGAEPTIDLVCVNADLLASLAQRGADDILRGDRTIAVWGWEVDVIPADWLAGFELVDELWVYSRFAASVLAQVSPVPVVPIPPPVVLAEGAGTVALPDGFIFLFMFDYLSTVARKNPTGLIEAFTRAFPVQEGPQLVLKTFNQSLRPEDHEVLREQAHERPDILFLDGYLSEPDKRALLERADCYVSMHRSEGFGLTLAEAMLLGKPAIATAYSGNLDFMTIGNSYLIDWRPTRVGPGVEIYPASGTWAEPDIDHAASLMRRVWERQDEARVKGQRARKEISTQLSPASAGARALARLRLLGINAQGPVRERVRG